MGTTNSINELKAYANQLADIRTQSNAMLADLYEVSKGMEYEEAMNFLADYQDTLDKQAEELRKLVKPKIRIGFC